MATPESRIAPHKGSTTPDTQAARSRTIHFDLRFLGTAAEQGSYTLKIGWQRAPLQRHTASTLYAAGIADTKEAPTHFAEVAAPADAAATVQLAVVYGPPDSNGIPSLSAVAIDTGSQVTYTSADIANAIAFMHPDVTVLEPTSASTVIGYIANTSAVLELQLQIQTLGAAWNKTKLVTDDHGNPVLGPNNQPYYTYDLDPSVLTGGSATSVEAKTGIYSDATLQGVRWNLDYGVSCIDVSPPSSLASPARTAATANGYQYDLQDGGPNYGVSCEIAAVNADGSIKIEITNGFIRHVSVYLGFTKADGVTPFSLTPDEWTALLDPDTQASYNAWDTSLSNSDDGGGLIGQGTNINFLGFVNAESTFMGVPVDSSSQYYTFGLPTSEGDIVGKIRIFAGSLGVSSGNDEDPAAAWVGLGLTALLDLAIPTFALMEGVGEESSKLMDSIFDDIPFLATTAYAMYVVAKDLITDDDNTGNDISGMLEALADQITQKVITSAEVVAKLAAYFGVEEAEEAIPIVGWALKLLAIEATVEQLAQTVAEVIASPRVVEFDITVTMNAVITLVPAVDGDSVPQFAATATSYEITAQYSDGTSRFYATAIADPNVAQLVANWTGIPVGGTVTFVVALYSEQGWLVGKGQSATIANSLAEGESALEVTIDIVQLLYPLDSQTTYQHSQLLVCQGASGYLWDDTPDAPTETAANLGSGQGGATLEAVSGITLNEDLGVLGYVWQATGLGIPPQGSGQQNIELWAFKNVALGPVPNGGVMNVPAGYDFQPQLVYLRDIGEPGSVTTVPLCFFVDPSGSDSDGYHLRQIVPVTDPDVPITDPSRQFNLATGTSWGRFNSLPTSMAIHANGVVVGVSPENPTLQLLQLPAAGVPDADAPWAAIRVGPGTRAGLLQGPTLVAVTPNQTILVLESGNARIQAFSKGGHPVQAFSATSNPCWIPLQSHAAGEIQYLAMTVEVKGYIYVLSQYGLGYDAADYWLDVYTPTGSQLFSQQGLVGAAATVDLWRNLYTLNYQQITGADGRTEPSVSEWIPNTPNTNS